MSVSDRYRELTQDVRELLKQLGGAEAAEGRREVRFVLQGVQELGGLAETVGEIPRIRLEGQLTPVLLKAHAQLDRARLLLEEQGAEDRAAAVWDLEQKIYRLLNDL
jgi:hypothetical protein